MTGELPAVMGAIDTQMGGKTSGRLLRHSGVTTQRVAGRKAHAREAIGEAARTECSVDHQIGAQVSERRQPPPPIRNPLLPVHGPPSERGSSCVPPKAAPASSRSL